MRVLFGVLVLGVCAWQTHARVADWRSDQALWTAATITTPTLPRPWLNLTVDDLRSSRTGDGWTHIRQALRAVERPEHAPKRAGMRPLFRAALLNLELSDPRCDQPEFGGWCVSLP